MLLLSVAACLLLSTLSSCCANGQHAASVAGSRGDSSSSSKQNLLTLPREGDALRQRMQSFPADDGGMDMLRAPYGHGHAPNSDGAFGTQRTLEEITQALALGRKGAVMQRTMHRRDGDPDTLPLPYEVFSVPPDRIPDASDAGLAGKFQLSLHTRAQSAVGITVARVGNPLFTFSVYEPGTLGTCAQGSGDNRTQTSTSARRYNCEFATNAGFFNTHTGECYGTLVSDGVVVQESAKPHAQLGIRADGTIEVGYLSDVHGSEARKTPSKDEPAASSKHASRETAKPPFVQLISGALWIVRDGAQYVYESMNAEDDSIQETGGWYYFASVKAARTGVGYDRFGNIVIVQHAGKTGSSGVSLWELADLMIEEGVVNGINLDGGGSSTSVVNGTLASIPTDECPPDSCSCTQTNCDAFCKRYTCERRVTTILCMHRPRPSTVTAHLRARQEAASFDIGEGSPCLSDRDCIPSDSSDDDTHRFRCDATSWQCTPLATHARIDKTAVISLGVSCAALGVALVALLLRSHGCFDAGKGHHHRQLFAMAKGDRRRRGNHRLLLTEEQNGAFLHELSELEGGDEVSTVLSTSQLLSSAARTTLSDI